MEKNTHKSDYQFELKLLRLLKKVKHVILTYIYYFIIATALSALIGYVVASFYYVPAYRSTATLIFQSRTQQSATLSVSSLFSDNSNSVGISNKEIMVIVNALYRNPQTLKTIQLNVASPIDETHLIRDFSAKILPGTQVLTLSFISDKPKLSADVVNIAADVLKSNISSIRPDLALQILEKGYSSNYPNNLTKKKTIFAVIFLLGTLLSIILIFTFLGLDREKITQFFFEHDLDIKVLGAIPKIKGKKDSLDVEHIVSTNPFSRPAEYFRAIKAYYSILVENKKGRTLLVTSAKYSEGKSTFISNFASTYAQANKKVLLVDFDLRNPRIQSIWNLDNKKGINDFLCDALPLESLVQRTTSDNVSCITSGKLTPRGLALINSDAIKTFFSMPFLQEFDIVLIDSPPLVYATETANIINYSDHTILVANVESERKRIWKNAEELIRTMKLPILGVVLNRTHIQKKNQYGYGKYYAFYQKKERSREER